MQQIHLKMLHTLFIIMLIFKLFVFKDNKGILSHSSFMKFNFNIK